ncbi:MAG: hypothetical protein U1F98_09630 [Verrucomicrobiota bacterium]
MHPTQIPTEIQRRLVRRFRAVLAIFIAGLILSGVTAFPLQAEIHQLASLLGIPEGADPASLNGLCYWIGYVRAGIDSTYVAYPFMAYGTDWLAFAHLVLAVFFLGPLREPTRHDWILVSGLIACAGVLPLALICGPMRGIPAYWQWIDCSFGILGCIPLTYCLRISRTLQRTAPAVVRA